MDIRTLLEDTAYGQALLTANKKMAKIVAAVKDTGKQGELTLKISVKREGQNAVIGISSKATVPEHSAPAGIFFFSGDGELSREDPRQMNLDETNIHRLPEQRKSGE